MNHFKKYILFYTAVPLLVLTVATSYYKFFVLHDYLVTYKVDCNPYESSCFVGCDDYGCVETYYYASVERKAADFLLICGQSVLGCEAAAVCLEWEGQCQVSYCQDDSGGECFHINNNDVGLSS